MRLKTARGEGGGKVLLRRILLYVVGNEQLATIGTGAKVSYRQAAIIIGIFYLEIDTVCVCRGVGR